MYDMSPHNFHMMSSSSSLLVRYVSSNKLQYLVLLLSQTWLLHINAVHVENIKTVPTQVVWAKNTYLLLYSCRSFTFSVSRMTENISLVPVLVFTVFWKKVVRFVVRCCLTKTFYCSFQIRTDWLANIKKNQKIKNTLFNTLIWIIISRIFEKLFNYKFYQLYLSVQKAYQMIFEIWPMFNCTLNFWQYARPYQH